MPSMHALPSDATAAAAPPIIPHALVDAFATVCDPRSRQGRRFTVAALLTLTIAAMLANHLSPLAIAQWGRNRTRRASERWALRRG